MTSGIPFSVTLALQVPTVPAAGQSATRGTYMDTASRHAIHSALVRLADGDRTAFDVVVDQLWPVILAFAGRGVGRGADAEDIAQEVFLRICARISEFDVRRDGVSWAFGIASYEILTQRRRRQRKREVHDAATLHEHADASESQEQALVARELRVILGEAMELLTDQDQQELGLAPAPALADVSGAARRKRKQRALERLRGIWRTLYGEP